MRPLYGFLWVTIAFGILAAVTSRLLYKEIAQYLPKDPDETEEEDEQISGGAAAGRGHEKSERKVRKELKKLDR